MRSSRGGGRRGRRGRTASTSGYLRMFLDHVLQADEGVDFDFLRGRAPGGRRGHRARRRGSPEMAPESSSSASTADAIVIGSGAFGASTAYHLAKRGLDGRAGGPARAGLADVSARGRAHQQGRHDAHDGAPAPRGVRGLRALRERDGAHGGLPSLRQPPRGLHGRGGGARAHRAGDRGRLRHRGDAGSTARRPSGWRLTSSRARRARSCTCRATGGWIRRGSRSASPRAPASWARACAPSRPCRAC